MPFDSFFNDVRTLSENASFHIGNRSYVVHQGVLKPQENIRASEAQAQTGNIFGFKWQQEDTFNSPASLARMKAWLWERYQSPEQWLSILSSSFPVVLDAGCGAGMSGFEYWNDCFQNIQYVGIDVSEAVNVAKKRFSQKNLPHGIFLQESIEHLPFEKPLFDVIFSEGVMHHTDNTEKTFSHLCQFLKPGGLFMFYVYRKKGPIREYTDDYIRDQLQAQKPEEAWEALKSLSQLGIALGELDVEIDVPADIPLLDIPKGKINLQRFFYWHVFKAFYDPKLTFEEMHHINFDWYAPKNAHRHTIEEIREWCRLNDLDIKLEKVEMAGITCVAQKA